MAAADYLAALLQSIGPLIAVAIVLSLVMVLAFYRTIGGGFAKTLLFVSPFAWLGAVAGFIAGSSREDLIGALLTGVLTVAGTLISYLVGKDAKSEWRQSLPLAMMLLFLCTLVGITMGSATRAKWDDFDREYAKWLKDYETITLPARATVQRYELCVARISPENKAKCEELLLGDRAKPSPTAAAR